MALPFMVSSHENLFMGHENFPWYIFHCLLSTNENFSWVHSWVFIIIIDLFSSSVVYKELPLAVSHVIWPEAHSFFLC